MIDNVYGLKRFPDFEGNVIPNNMFITIKCSTGLINIPISDIEEFKLNFPELESWPV